MDHEEWRDVVGYEGLYSVSSLGRVRSNPKMLLGRGGGLRLFPGCVLKGEITNAGYDSVRLSKNGIQSFHTTHRVVAAAFLGPCPAGHEVNHLNGAKLDNRPQNIEYATGRANTMHAYATGLKGLGEDHHRSKLTAEQVRRIRATNITPKGSAKVLAAELGVSIVTVRKVHRGCTWTHLADKPTDHEAILQQSSGRIVAHP